MLKRLFFLFRDTFLVLFFFNTLGISQTPSSNLVGRINISSPNASSLGKYIDMPVSYHTGIPSIGIPIYDMKSGAVSIPIALGYHAGGIKVEETASWVGLGWTLNAGGVITRVVRDKPDEKQAADMNEQHGYFSDYGFTTTVANTNQGFTTQPTDFEPDMFNFSYPGGSGKFVFDEDRTPVFFPQQDLKIEYFYTPGNSAGRYGGPNDNMGRCIERFIITNKDGVRYYFGMLDVPPVTPFVHPIELSTNYTCVGGGQPMAKIITSWYLYRIESANGEDVIELNYERDRYANYTHATSLGAINNYFQQSSSSTNCNRVSPIKLFTFGVRLRSIISPLEKVDFIPGNNREDLSRWNSADLEQQYTDFGVSSSPTLGSIILSSQNGSCLKRFNFSYDYFVDNTSTVNSNLSFINVDRKRLRLLSVRESSCDGSIVNPPYTFEYFSDFLPRRMNFSRDHWGFNNGAIGNVELFPQMTDNRGDINQRHGLSVNNREPAWPAMRAGTIRKITYPTGGSSEYEFEPNTVPIVVNGAETNATIGGLRVKRIELYDPLTNNKVERKFFYSKVNTEVSSGILFGRPIYIQIFKNDFAGLTRQRGVGNGCSWNIMYAGITDTGRHYIVSDNSLRPMETTMGNHVGYSRVVEEISGNGKIVLHYNTIGGQSIPASLPNSIAQAYINNPGPCNADILNFPAAPVQFNPKRGLLEKEEVYDQTGKKLKEVTYSYLHEDAGFRVPGQITYFMGSSTTNYSANVHTHYELRTSKLIAMQKLESLFQEGQAPLTNFTESFFESSNHNEATKIRRFNSSNKPIETKMLYAYDFKTAAMIGVSNCSANGSNSYLELYNSLLLSKQVDLAACGTNDVCRQNILVSLNKALLNSRKGYVTCRKTNYTNTLADNGAWSHSYNILSNALFSANAEFKPLLWLQRKGRNELIEESKWTDGKLLAATLYKYVNNRDDVNGIYLSEQMAIEPTSLSSTFQPVAVNANNISISTDTRYTNIASMFFNKGNLISILERNGNRTSYEWSPDSKLPVAIIKNARNEYREQIVPGEVTLSHSGILGATSGSYSKEVNFTQTQIGNISFSLTSPPPGARVSLSISLTGPISANTTICMAGSGAPSCSGVSSIVSFNNMPIGNYTANLTASTSFGSYSFTYSFGHTYEGNIIGLAGTKEFYINTFEYDYSQHVVSGNAHTGNKFLNASFTFSPNLGPDKQYNAQWWQLVNGNWIFNSAPYNSGQLLAGPVDNVRIFPLDASVQTFTYTDDGRITSETDPNGRTTFYEYDAFNRLMYTKDQHGNILKKYCYNFAGQPIDCKGQTFFSNAYSANFQRNNCGTGFTGNTVPFSVQDGMFTSTISQEDANQKAIAYVSSNGQAYANDNGVCIQQTYYNQAYSANFQRNNCGTGFTGSIIAFSVPAGMFSSTISPEDAQQKAIDYANANGQANANDFGLCIPSDNCNYNNCGYQGPNFKCINGVCYQGYPVYLGPDLNNSNECRWQYKWWDGSYLDMPNMPKIGETCLMNE
jgi:YD repeat-containing protein